MATIFEIIKADHEKIDGILSKIEKTKESQSDARQRYFDKLKDLVETHAESEEKAVYDVLKTKEKTKKLAYGNAEEHHVVGTLLKEMADLSPAEPEWEGKVGVVTNALREHVKEEESEMFKKMKQVCDEAELKQMAYDMKELERGTASRPQWVKKVREGLELT